MQGSCIIFLSCSESGPAFPVRYAACLHLPGCEQGLAVCFGMAVRFDMAVCFGMAVRFDMVVCFGMAVCFGIVEW